MLYAGGTIDILRMPSRRRNPAIEGLAELAHHNEIVNRTVPQGAEQIRPALRQRMLSPTEELDEAFPCVRGCEFSGREIA